MSRDLGHGSRYELDEAVNTILHQAGYSVQHRWETPSRIYYETGWMTRRPYHDERARGAEECRTRIIVEAHRQRINVYSVKLRAENTARTRFEGQWGPAPVSSKFEEHVEDISTAINLKIDAGVRVY